jgi:hypothetical protein
MIELYTKTINAEGWLKYWAIFLILFPFYIFPPGIPQPSDIFLLIVLFAYVSKNGFQIAKSFMPYVVNFRNLMFYITVVSIITFITRIGFRDKDPSIIVPLFYYFNFIVMCFSFSLFNKYKIEFVNTTIYSIVLSGLIQFLFSPYGKISEGRETLFFDNPNQLGYYSICSLSIILVLEREIKISRFIVFLSFACFFYFTMLCVSKAAIGGMIILIIVYMISNKLLTLRTFFTAIIVIMGLGLALFKTENGEQFMKNLKYRNDYSVKPTDVSEWEYRGYDRMNNHPYYMILGAGEGSNKRFETYIENHEMHSSLGTILFCYGIPGSILFIIFIVSLLKGLPFTHRLYIFPVIAYGLVHMGLRFTIFYIALLMFPLASHIIDIQRENEFLHE